MQSLEALQRALQAHILKGEIAIADAIESPEEISAATRLKIYSDAYRLRLIEALQANYPILAQFVGEEDFARLTQEYLAIYPSRHFSIRWFGHLLAEFLGEFPDYSQRPWLAELAAWEWKIATAFDATDRAALRPESLANLAPENWPELRFVFHPSAQRIALQWNIVPIMKAATDELALPAAQRLERTSNWLIWREHLTVQYRSLDPIETAAIDAALGGATFSEICELVAQELDEERAPLRAASFLKQWLANECLVQT